MLINPAASAQQILQAFGTRIAANSNHSGSRVLGEINRALGKLIVNAGILTPEEKRLKETIGPVAEFRQRMSERFGYRTTPAQQREPGFIPAAPPIGSAETLPTIVGLPIALRGAGVLSEEHLRALAVELGMSSHGSRNALAESLASRLAGMNPPGLANVIRQRVGLRPIRNITEGLPVNVSLEPSEREQQRLDVLRTIISGIVDLIVHYKITKPVKVTQLRSQWPGLNIQRTDSQAAVKDGIIPHRSEGANYHQKVIPEEIALLNLIYKHSDQGLNEGKIAEAKMLIREEFTSRGLI